VSRRAAVALAGLVLALLGVFAAPPAAAAPDDDRTVTAGREGLRAPPRANARPSGRRLRALDARRIAERLPKVVAARRAEDGRTFSRAYLKGRDHWQVSVFAVPGGARERTREIAQVLIDDRDGHVDEAWTGVQVAWPMARGYSGAFGRQANAPYLWIPLCLLFLAPFARPPLRWLHADLLVLLAFSASYAFFGAAELGVSVPSAALLLAYLLVRTLRIAWRPPVAAAPLRLPSPELLGVAVVFLLGFRIGLNVTDGNVIDVGYASVIGADRMGSGDALYGAFPPDNERGDTYGPVTYLAYVPFELLWPWSGTWDDLPAAHGAGVAFDLAAIGLVFALGRRLRGLAFGALLAYLWVTYPFTLLVLNSGANDGLVGALVALALVVAARPAARGAAVALAGLTKFAPLALGPLLATYRASARAVALTALGFALAALLALAPVLLGDGLGAFWERTVGFQSDRDSPFSPWGFYGGLDGLQTAVQLGAVLLALLVAVVPRRRDEVTLAALAAAVLIAAQLAVSHWFYLYLVWFLPALLVALLAPLVTTPGAAPARSTTPSAARPSG
jgi:hypothetical protein